MVENQSTACSKERSSSSSFVYEYLQVDLHTLIHCSVAHRLLHYSFIHYLSYKKLSSLLARFK